MVTVYMLHIIYTLHIVSACIEIFLQVYFQYFYVNGFHVVNRKCVSKIEVSN